MPGRSAWVPPLFAASTLVAACLTVATWSGWPSACAASGTLLATAARLHTAPQPMRRLFLGASLCWGGHNLLVGSVFGLTCDVLTICGLAIALLRAVETRTVEPEGLGVIEGLRASQGRGAGRCRSINN
ncbi:YgjV family protein [Methylobacterium sp. PvR107]|uniref:YgjV family protein n=1 Tax=Methylobacterium sp. PvR107 TaxID=2806597 RepID=UPI001B75DE54|nr:hypothetical protein [Methylobacterium sp. PvR107]